ncbi:MAG: gamma-glutamyl-gamma-aminobutyrate hydrolase family protein [Actinomycetota bacterium]|nr:gamma-glutamyl-gamma-aminobutyrate hydrolase family protein [Actinomycetota bacterium]
MHAKALMTFGLPRDEIVPEGVDFELDLDPDDASVLDGASALVLPGGGDIDPQLYGRPRHPRTHKVSYRRDHFEMTLLARALAEGLPVLAICKGMQLLNVHLGGTLIQHLADDATRLEHDRDAPRSDPAHAVTLKKGCKLASVFGTRDIEVNSHHHQGLDDVAPDLEPVAWAEDGVLEAVEHRHRSWVIGVQWHPEAMSDVDPVQAKLFDALIEAARSYDEGMRRTEARSA